MNTNFSNLNTAFNTFFGACASALTVYSVFIIKDDTLNRKVFWWIVAIYLLLLILYIILFKPVRVNVGIASKREKLLFKLEEILRTSHQNKFPVTILCKNYEEYKQISSILSKQARKSLIWTLYGSPIDVAGWNDNKLLTGTDDVFANFKSKNKIRFVIFDTKDDLIKYQELAVNSTEGRRRTEFTNSIIFNGGKLLLSYKDGICSYLGCSCEDISSCVKRKNKLDFEFGFVQPTSWRIHKRICLGLTYLFNKTKYQISKRNHSFIDSFGFETGFKTGIENSDKHINHITFYPFEFNLEELQHNGYDNNPNYSDKYENLYGDIECQLNLINKLTSNNSENNFTDNIEDIKADRKHIIINQQ